MMDQLAPTKYEGIVNGYYFEIFKVSSGWMVTKRLPSDPKIPTRMKVLTKDGWEVMIKSRMNTIIYFASAEEATIAMK